MNSNSKNVYIYSTDTVWGIGCSIYSETGFLRICSIKQTATDKPMSIMFSTIDDVFNSFRFSDKITKAWLKEFFKLETTLGIPLENAFIEIPKWATGKSAYVTIRCLESSGINQIFEKIKCPFFTTSLNLTGSLPVLTNPDALVFQQLHAPDAIFIKEKEDEQLSGASSTIVFLDNNLNFEIKREGLKVDQVKFHLSKITI
jgi:L-threonylcarbamoyladenylate synthase